jgi:hypothetical protein
MFTQKIGTSFWRPSGGKLIHFPKWGIGRKRRLRAMQGPRTMSTAHRVIQGIEAVQMIRKAQLVGSQRTNPATTSIAIALLLKIA